MNRREFILGSVAAGAAASITAAAPAGASGLQRAIRIDAEGVLEAPELDEAGILHPSPRFVKAIRERTMDAISMTLGEPGNRPDRFRTCVAGIAYMDRIIENNPSFLMKIQKGEDLAVARRSRRLGIFYTFADSTGLEGDASRVQLFQTLGLRMMQLTYNRRNLAGDGCLEKANAGLSDFGREVVAAMNKSRLLLDLSHAGQRTMAEAIDVSEVPPTVSHSGCRALTDLPRNTRDEEMRALAHKGGVFGVYLMPFLRIGAQPLREDLLRHLDHARNVCGEDHVGIGTDNPLFGYEITEAALRQQREFFESRTKLGLVAPGESPDYLMLVDGYNDVDRFDRIATDLKQRGWTAAQIDKLLGDNFARVFAEVWG